MNTDNILFIEGGAYTDVKKALRQWVDLYAVDLENDWTFELYKNGRASHVIKADSRLDNERFFYLVNYMNFPEHINYTVSIQGFTLGKEDNQLKNCRLLVYISQNDTDYDNVYVITDDQRNFKVDFGGKISEVNESKDYLIRDIPSLENPDILTVRKPRKHPKKEEHKKQMRQRSISKRYKIISVILISLLLLGLLTIQNKDNFVDYNYFLGMGVWMWFFIDYKMLQVKKYYLLSLLIAIVLFLYGQYMKDQLDGQQQSNLFRISAFLPLLFLMIQLPLRLSFIHAMKREPVIDKPPPSFVDGVYMIVLLLATLYLPVIFLA